MPGSEHSIACSLQGRGALQRLDSTAKLSLSLHLRGWIGGVREARAVGRPSVDVQGALAAEGAREGPAGCHSGESISLISAHTSPGWPCVPGRKARYTSREPSVKDGEPVGAVVERQLCQVACVLAHARELHADHGVRTQYSDNFL